MDLNNLLKLAGLAAQRPEAQTEVDEEGVPGEANTKPDPQMFPDGISNLGSVSDTSLRRYLKAKGHPVSVDEATYPNYTVDDVLESYEAYTAAKAANRSVAEGEIPAGLKAYQDKKSGKKSDDKDTNASNGKMPMDAGKDGKMGTKDDKPAFLKKESAELMDNVTEPEELEALLATNESVNEGKLSDMHQDAQEMTRAEFIKAHGDSQARVWDQVQSEEDMQENIDYLKKLAGI
jgi:hypothetical protein|tara:strand:+ start:6767 stop:7468 length:702 start_codon:yes stop_codon:yes gene_type:complete